MATAIPQNRVPFTPAEIAAATGGRLVRDGAPSIGVCTDSRAAIPGCAFFAIGGERFDGHAFVAEASSNGASTFVVSREDKAPSLGAVIVVGDTRRALGDLARAHREKSRAHVVAITGSAGKTTTRKAIVRLLEVVAPGGTHAPPGNLNNDIGVPMTLFGIGREHAFVVVELGTNQKGEIARLSEIARPDLGVVTLVAAAHTEGIGSIDDVAREKGALFLAIADNGIAVGNADDARVMTELARSPARVKIGYGLDPRATYRVVRRIPRGLFGADLVIERPTGLPLHARTPLLGMAGALATSAAVAVVETLTGTALEDGEVTAALAPLASAADGRLALSVLVDGTILIDDSYNANSASMLASIDSAEELSRSEGKRLVLVLGEMRELGVLSEKEHANVADRAARSSAAVVVAVGKAAACIADRARAMGKETAFAEDAERARVSVLDRAKPGDLVLVKGSRGISLEQVVDALVENASRATRGSAMGGSPGTQGPAEALASPCSRMGEGP